MTVREVAAELGFDDELYFSRAFSREAGVSPTGYRKALGEGKGPGLY